MESVCYDILRLKSNLIIEIENLRQKYYNSQQERIGLNEGEERERALGFEISCFRDTIKGKEIYLAGIEECIKIIEGGLSKSEL